jgi:pSer/pThr/pTyr-binding forkhead associated (FHA) protein
MWKLTIEDDEGNQTPLPLAHEEYGIGRAESNSIRLTDRNVSRNHAILKKNGQGWFLKDLSSYNGTYVNGARVIGEQVVHSGDVIQLGDYRLEMLDEGAVAQQAAPAPAVPPVHQRPNRLVVVVGPQPGTEYPLDKEHFTLGRSEDATISINHSSVSRVHAELFALGNGRFEIVDKASANGIRINGVELKRGILEAGDALELGDVRLRFVGAGKIFRADMTQNLPAVAGFDMSRSVGPGKGGGLGLGKLIGIGAVVGILAVIGIVALVRPGNTGPSKDPGKKHVVTEKSAKQVDEALKLLDGKDYDGAHKKLLEIPEADRPTDDANFKKVESAWADWKFQQVNDAADSKAKKTLLKEIASTETVDPKQRTRAAEMIREIEAKEPPPVPTYQPGQGGPVGTFNPSPGDTATAPKTVTAPPANTVPSGTSDYDAIKRQLEPRVWSGRGSVEDIKMLKAVCKQLGDRACRDRADAMLKKKLGE